MYGLIGIGIGALATIVGLVTGWWNRGTEQRKIDLDQQKFLARPTTNRAWGSGLDLGTGAPPHERDRVGP